MIFEEKPPKCGSLLGFSYPPLESITKETKHLDATTKHRPLPVKADAEA
jgi:hypothetical protein